MSNGRHVLLTEDKRILDEAKASITEAITKLKQRNVRNANIQIELEWHIRNSLKE